MFSHLGEELGTWSQPLSEICILISDNSLGWRPKNDYKFRT
jgi:hypothetical protein